MEETRFVALDVGERRIGVAISDPLGFSAQGLGVLQRRGEAQDLQALRNLVVPYNPRVLVVGLPRHMNGSLGPQAEKIKQLALEWGQKLGLSVEYWDERLSTVAAERTLLEADLSRRRRRQVRDKLAAVYILQGYLDRRAGS